MILGITGGTGTGKTSVCDYFKNQGYVIIDSDAVARKVCAKGTACLKEIVGVFGQDITDSDGNLKRKELGRIVFSDAQKLKTLNCITHKYIIESIKETIRENPDKNIVIDAPLLIESGLDSVCTKILCVLADTDTRLKRIMQRDSLSQTEAQDRILSQPNDDFYISKCDYVLYNNGDFENLSTKLSDIFGGTDGR